MSYLQGIFGLIVALYVFWVIAHKLGQRGRPPLPPGPKGVPVFGNLLQLPRECEWLTYRDMSKIYGDVMCLSAAGQPIIILNTRQAAHDLLVSRGSTYAGRPKLQMAGELMGFENIVVLLQDDNSHHTEARRLIHVAGSAAQVTSYHAMEERETCVMLAKIFDNPERLLDHIRVSAVSKTLQITYGYTPKTDDDFLVKMINDLLNDFSAASNPGVYLVDFLPILKYIPSWVPGAYFKRFAEEVARKLTNAESVPYQMVKKQVLEGTATPSLGTKLLEDQDNPSAEKEKLLAMVMLSVYGGGADTTVSAIKTFFLTMGMHPNVQAKAQAELDAWLGTGDDARLPTFADRPQLPYLEHILWEVLRWGTVTPLGVAHRAMRDDVYNGMRIPNGSIVIGNIWSMLHDEAFYPNPNTFDPDRYTNAAVDGAVNKDPRQIAFGFGRRICPGLHIADASVWANIAITLATCDLLLVEDETFRSPLTPDRLYEGGAISHPKPFSLKIKPRSSRAAVLVRNALLVNNE